MSAPAPSEAAAASSSSAPGRIAGDGDGRFRNAFAKYILVFSAAGMLVATVVSVVPFGREGQTLMAQREVFLALVPLFGTWIGTLIAYYFSRESVAAANATVGALLEKLTPEQRLNRTPISAVWVPRSGISGFPLEESDDEGAVPLSALDARFSADKVTRMPLMTKNGRVRFIVHRSVLDAFLAKPPASLSAAPTLKDFLNQEQDGRTVRWRVAAIVFVPVGASLADAQKRMSAAAGCQDVVVTRTGSPTEPVEGWLTNSDIARFIES